MSKLLPGLSLLLCPALLLADGADVLEASVQCSDNLCRFSVTVAHDDQGWDHYADGIEILNAAQDTLLGYRKLRHPHTGQASFTRPVSVLFDELPEYVIIRAHDSVHGYTGSHYELGLEQSR